MSYPYGLNLCGQVLPANRQATTAAVRGECSRFTAGHGHPAEQCLVVMQFQLALQLVGVVLNRLLGGFTAGEQ